MFVSTSIYFFKQVFFLFFLLRTLLQSAILKGDLCIKKCSHAQVLTLSTYEWPVINMKLSTSKAFLNYTLRFDSFNTFKHTSFSLGR